MPGLRCLEHQFLPDAASLSLALAQTGNLLSLRPYGSESACYQFAGQLNINDLPLLSYSGAGVHCIVEPRAEVMLAACFAGHRQVQDPRGDVHSTPGGAVLMPVGDGRRTYSSPIGASAAAVNMTPAAITRVAAAISGQPHDPGAIQQRFACFRLRALSPSQAQPLHSLVRHIDDSACVDPLLPARLGLDDVILRLVATWLNPDLLTEQSSDPMRLRERTGRSAFDELIDYMRAHLDQPLRLSDLEARSFYSRRALQYAFREKLGCTPRQWIREQRLSKAMESLQTQPTLSIRALALACGYRQPSQFSADFKRRFDLSPSQIRRQNL